MFFFLNLKKIKQKKRFTCAGWGAKGVQRGATIKIRALRARQTFAPQKLNPEYAHDDYLQVFLR